MLPVKIIMFDGIVSQVFRGRIRRDSNQGRCSGCVFFIAAFFLFWLTDVCMVLFVFLSCFRLVFGINIPFVHTVYAV